MCSVKRPSGWLPRRSNETCPFDFANKEQARVIAGEEEAAYAWVAVNFVDGALLEATSGPFGTAVPIRARGSMEMGGLACGGRRVGVWMMVGAGWCLLVCASGCALLRACVHV